MRKKKIAKENKLRKFIDKFQKSSVAFFVLFVCFCLVGLFTIGVFNAPGKSYTLREKSTIVYQLERDSSQTLNDIYLNVGNVYAKNDGEVTLTFARASSSASSWLTSSLGTVKIGNVDTANNAGSNYNYKKIFADKNISSSYMYIRVTTNANVQINEIVFVGNDGKIIPASISSTYSTNIDAKKAAYTLDAQKSFSKSESFMFRFSQQEEYILETISNIKLGNEYVDGDGYMGTMGFGMLGVYLIMLGTLVFGYSTFGLRIVPFIATCVTLYLAFRLFEKFFKNRWLAVVYSYLFAVSGIALSVGRMGTPYSLAALCVVGSIYFMYKFYFSGISSTATLRSAMNIFASGVFFACGVMIDLVTVFPLLVSVAIFVLGMIRQKNAMAYAQKKLAEEYAVLLDETKDAERKEELKKEGILKTKENIVAYAQKKRYAYGLFAAGFIAVTAILFIVLAMASYNTLVKMYALTNKTAPLFSVAIMHWGNTFFNDVTTLTEANHGLPLGWLISLKGATVQTSSTDVFFNALNATLNIAVALLSLASVIAVIVYLVTKRKAPSKEYKTVLVSACLLGGGMLLSLLPYFFIPQASAIDSLVFSIFYMGFIPLACRLLLGSDVDLSAGEVKATREYRFVLIFAVVVGVVFLLQTPMIFGYKVPVIMERIMFAWATIVNNGVFRI